MAGHGKRIRDARAKATAAGAMPLEQALDLVKENARAKFDETVEVAINLGIDARKSDQSVRGACELPRGSGKQIRVAVFARGSKAEEATAAGADIVGAEDLIEAVEKGEINFDRCVAAPDMMMLVGKVARVLGPRGLMPNPKVGTVTPAVGEAVRKAKAGEIQFRAEKGGLVHAGIGRASFETPALAENLRALVGAVTRARPAGTKGTYLRKLSVSSTMGPGVCVDLSTISG